MEGKIIKLESLLSGNYKIAKPSGKKITAKDLRVGRYYYQPEQYKYRFIIKIDHNGILYNDGIGVAYCSPQHFVKKCPHEATPEEVLLLKKDLQRFLEEEQLRKSGK